MSSTEHLGQAHGLGAAFLSQAPLQTSSLR